MKKIVALISVLLIAASVALVACSGGSSNEAPIEEDPAAQFEQYEGMTVIDTYYALEGSGWDARFIETDTSLQVYSDSADSPTQLGYDATEDFLSDIFIIENSQLKDPNGTALDWHDRPYRYVINSVMEVDTENHVVSFEIVEGDDSEGDDSEGDVFEIPTSPAE